MTNTVHEKELDTEWINLIEEALKIGLSADEIREFLQGNN